MGDPHPRGQPWCSQSLPRPLSQCFQLGMLADARARAATLESGSWGGLRSAQHRARATGGKMSLEFTAVQGGRCFPRGHSVLTFPYGSHGAAPGLGPAGNNSELLRIIPAQCSLTNKPEWGRFPWAFSNCFVTLLVFQSRFAPVKSFLLVVVSSPPSSAPKGRTRKTGSASNPNAPNTPRQSQAALGADPK